MENFYKMTGKWRFHGGKRVKCRRKNKLGYRFEAYRAVLFKWEFIIQMRDAVSQLTLDIEESYFSKNTLFFFKNDFSFYYLKL